MVRSDVKNRKSKLFLVLGGARSGKSRIAEELISTFPCPWVYVATSRIFDQEMRERVMLHKQRRTSQWETVEEPLNISDVLTKYHDKPILIDCLTLWLTNLLLENRDISGETERLLEALQQRKNFTVLVGNEVGLSIVPENKLARRFRDESGLLHQKIAAQADEVLFVAAGLPLKLKGN